MGIDCAKTGTIVIRKIFTIFFGKAILGRDRVVKLF